MEIINLKDAPHHAPTLARWFQSEWGHLNPEKTYDDILDDLLQCLNEAVVPTLLVGEIDGELVGSAALIKSDMDSHPELTPWLANVFVRPEYRGQKLANSLISSICALAQQHLLSPIYLFTPNHESLYLKLGWETLSVEPLNGEDVTLMRRQL